MNRTMQLHAAVVRYAGGAVLEPHAHNSASVSVVLAGSIEEQVGSRSEIGSVGSIVAKPAGVEHGNRIGRDGALLLAIRGEAVNAVAADGWCWTQSRYAVALGVQIARRLKSNAAADAEQLVDLLALASDARPGSRRSAWLDEVRSRLDREANPPSVSALADGSDVHPVYLARAFRQQFGCSIREYRRRNRVQRAAALLAGSDLAVAEIAARLDYFDQSHLCRDFRAELAVSPSDYRTIVRR